MINSENSTNSTKSANSDNSENSTKSEILIYSGMYINKIILLFLISLLLLFFI
jgi:hypothetical protein